MYESRRLPIKLTPERRAELEHENAEIDIQLQVHAEDLDRFKAETKAKTKPIAETRKKNLIALRSGAEDKDVEVMEMRNDEDATFEYIDKDGILIYTRDMTRKEMVEYGLFSTAHGIQKRADLA